MAIKGALLKYCRQLGIIALPKLVFKPEDFYRYDNRYTIEYLRRCVGTASLKKNVILVNLDYRGNVKRWRYWSESVALCSISSKWNLREATRTLVHELLHLRFYNLRHGYFYERRINEILEGRKFEIQNRDQN
jgi:hypothetical protein